MEIVEKYTGLDINGDGLDGNNKIRAIDESEEDVQLVITTIDGGHYHRRTHIYKPEQQHAQEWLDLLLKYSSRCSVLSW